MKCVVCESEISDGVYVGMGNGDGQEFGHRSCYEATREPRKFEFSSVAVRRLEYIRQALGRESLREVVRDSCRLMEWALRQRAEGRRLALINQDESVSEVKLVSTGEGNEHE